MKLTWRLMALLQGVYYVIPSAWPFIHLPSFLYVTGPKTDIWLLYTVSGLLLVIGGVLLLAAIRNAVTRELQLLAIGSAIALALVDVIYSTNNTISDIYRYDALGELFLVAGWLLAKPIGKTQHLPGE